MSGSVIAPGIAAAVGILAGIYLILQDNTVGIALICLGTIMFVLAARNFGAQALAKKGEDNAGR